MLLRVIFIGVLLLIFVNCDNGDTSTSAPDSGLTKATQIILIFTGCTVSILFFLAMIFLFIILVKDMVNARKRSRKNKFEIKKQALIDAHNLLALEKKSNTGILFSNYTTDIIIVTV